jgi:hypothetical protein
MKISKQRIQEIIKEELALAETELQQPSDKQAASPVQPDQKKDVNSRQKLALKFKALSKELKDAQGIDSVEAKLINAIIDKVVGDSNNDNFKRELMIALKKLGVEV